MHFGVVDFKLLKGGERQRLFVGWKRAFHHCFGRSLVEGLYVFRGVG